MPAVIPRLNRVTSRVLSPRTYSDVAHRVVVSPRRVVFREMEYAVPREVGLDVLRDGKPMTLKPAQLILANPKKPGVWAPSTWSSSP